MKIKISVTDGPDDKRGTEGRTEHIGTDGGQFAVNTMRELHKQEPIQNQLIQII